MLKETSNVLDPGILVLHPSMSQKDKGLTRRQAAVNGSTFCGIDINKPKGKQRILDSFKTVVDLCYGKSQ